MRPLLIDPEVPIKLFDPGEASERGKERVRVSLGTVLPSLTRPSVMKPVLESPSYRAADAFLEMIDRNGIPDATRCHINLRVRRRRRRRGRCFHTSESSRCDGCANEGGTD